MEIYIFNFVVFRLLLSSWEWLPQLLEAEFPEPIWAEESYELPRPNSGLVIAGTEDAANPRAEHDTQGVCRHGA